MRFSRVAFTEPRFDRKPLAYKINRTQLRVMKKAFGAWFNATVKS